MTMELKELTLLEGTKQPGRAPLNEYKPRLS